MYKRQLISSVTAQYFAAKAAVGFSTKLRHILFEDVYKRQGLPINAFSQEKIDATVNELKEERDAVSSLLKH